MRELAGHYAQPADEGLGGHSGDDLHSFPDGTFRHAHRAYVVPLTIGARGRWQFDRGAVTLAPDAGPPLLNLDDRRLIPLAARVEGVLGEVQKYKLLLGAGEQLSYYRGHVEDGDDYRLLSCTLVRRKVYTPEEAAGAKERLLRTCYRVEGDRMVELGAQ